MFRSFFQRATTAATSTPNGTSASKNGGVTTNNTLDSSTSVANGVGGGNSTSNSPSSQPNQQQLGLSAGLRSTIASTAHQILQVAVARRNQHVKELVIQCQLADFEGIADVIDVYSLAAEELITLTHQSVSIFVHNHASLSNTGNNNNNNNSLDGSAAAELVQVSVPHVSDVDLNLLHSILNDISNIASITRPDGNGQPQSLLPVNKIDVCVQLLWRAFHCAEGGGTLPTQCVTASSLDSSLSSSTRTRSASHAKMMNPLGGGAESTYFSGMTPLTVTQDRLAQRMAQTANALVRAAPVGSSQLQNTLSFIFIVYLQSRSNIAVAAASAAILQSSLDVLRPLIYDSDFDISATPPQQQQSVLPLTPSVTKQAGLVGVASGDGEDEAAASSTTPVLLPSSPTPGPPSLLPPPLSPERLSNNSRTGGGGGAAPPTSTKLLSAQHMQGVLLFRDLCLLVSHQADGSSSSTSSTPSTTTNAKGVKTKWLCLVNPITTALVAPTEDLKMMLLEVFNDVLTEAAAESRRKDAAAVVNNDDEVVSTASLINPQLRGSEMSQQGCGGKQKDLFKYEHAVNHISPLLAQCINEEFTALVINHTLDVGTDSSGAAVVPSSETKKCFVKLTDLAVYVTCRFYKHMYHSAVSIINRHALLIGDDVGCEASGPILYTHTPAPSTSRNNSKMNTRGATSSVATGGRALRRRSTVSISATRGGGNIAWKMEAVLNAWKRVLGDFNALFALLSFLAPPVTTSPKTRKKDGNAGAGTSAAELPSMNSTMSTSNNFNFNANSASSLDLHRTQSTLERRLTNAASTAMNAKFTENSNEEEHDDKQLQDDGTIEQLEQNALNKSNVSTPSPHHHPPTPSASTAGAYTSNNGILALEDDQVEQEAIDKIDLNVLDSSSIFADQIFCGGNMNNHCGGEVAVDLRSFSPILSLVVAAIRAVEADSASSSSSSHSRKQAAVEFAVVVCQSLARLTETIFSENNNKWPIINSEGDDDTMNLPLSPSSMSRDPTTSLQQRQLRRKSYADPNTLNNNPVTSNHNSLTAAARLTRQIILLLAPGLGSCVQLGLREALLRHQLQQMRAVERLSAPITHHNHDAGHHSGLGGNSSGGGGRAAGAASGPSSAAGGSDVGGGAMSYYYGAEDDNEAIHSYLKCATNMLRSSCMAQLPIQRHMFLKVLCEHVFCDNGTWLHLNKNRRGYSHHLLTAVFRTIVMSVDGMGSLLGQSWPLVCRVFIQISLCFTSAKLVNSSSSGTTITPSSAVDHHHHPPLEREGPSQRGASVPSGSGTTTSNSGGTIPYSSSPRAARDRIAKAAMASFVSELEALLRTAAQVFTTAFNSCLQEQLAASDRHASSLPTITFHKSEHGGVNHNECSRVTTLLQLSITFLNEVSGYVAYASDLLVIDFCDVTTFKENLLLGGGEHPTVVAGRLNCVPIVIPPFEACIEMSTTALSSSSSPHGNINSSNQQHSNSSLSALYVAELRDVLVFARSCTVEGIFKHAVSAVAGAPSSIGNSHLASSKGATSSFYSGGDVFSTSTPSGTHRNLFMVKNAEIASSLPRAPHAIDIIHLLDQPLDVVYPVSTEGRSSSGEEDRYRHTTTTLQTTLGKFLWHECVERVLLCPFSNVALMHRSATTATTLFKQQQCVHLAACDEGFLQVYAAYLTHICTNASLATEFASSLLSMNGLLPPTPASDTSPSPKKYGSSGLFSPFGVSHNHPSSVELLSSNSLAGEPGCGSQAETLFAVRVRHWGTQLLHDLLTLSTVVSAPQRHSNPRSSSNTTSTAATFTAKEEQMSEVIRRSSRALTHTVVNEVHRGLQQAAIHTIHQDDWCHLLAVLNDVAGGSPLNKNLLFSSAASVALKTVTRDVDIIDRFAQLLGGKKIGRQYNNLASSVEGKSVIINNNDNNDEEVSQLLRMAAVAPQYVTNSVLSSTTLLRCEAFTAMQQESTSSSPLTLLEALSEEQRWRVVSRWLCGRVDILRGQPYAACCVSSTTPTPDTSTTTSPHTTTMYICNGHDDPSSVIAGSSEEIQLAFRALEAVHHNCITSIRSSDALAALCSTTGAFVVQQRHKKLALNLSSVQMLWSLADYLVSLQQEQANMQAQFLRSRRRQHRRDPNDYNDGGDTDSLQQTHSLNSTFAGTSNQNASIASGKEVSATAMMVVGSAPPPGIVMRSGSITFPPPSLQLLGSGEEDNMGGGGDSSALIGGFSVEQVGFLWGSLVLQLRRGIFDDRVEIRQSCIKTFFALLTTHGTTSMPSSAWDVSFWMVLVRLSAMLSSCNQQPSSKPTSPATSCPPLFATTQQLSPTPTSPSQALHGLLCGGYLLVNKVNKQEEEVNTSSSPVCGGGGEERFFPVNGIPLTSPIVTSRLLTKLIGDTKARCELQVSLLEPIARCLRLFNAFLLVPLDNIQYDYSLKATFAQLDGDDDSDMEQPYSHNIHKIIKRKRLPVSEFPRFLETVLQFAGSCVEQEGVSGGGGSGNGGEVMLLSSTKAILTILGDYWGLTLPIASWEEVDSTTTNHPTLSLLTTTATNATTPEGGEITGRNTKNYKALSATTATVPTGKTRYVLSSMSVAGAWRVLEKACGTHPSASNGTLTTTVAGLWDLIQSAMRRGQNNNGGGGGVGTDAPQNHITASSLDTSLNSSMIGMIVPATQPTSAGTVSERDSAFTQSVPFSSFFSLLGHVLQSNVVKAAYFFPAPPQQSVLDTLTLLIKHVTTNSPLFSSTSTITTQQQLQENIGVVQGALSVVLDTFPTESYFRETADFILLAVIEVPFALLTNESEDTNHGRDSSDVVALKTLRDLVKSLPVSEKDRKARLASTFSPIGSHPKFLLTVMKTLEGQLLPLLQQAVKSSLPRVQTTIASTTTKDEDLSHHIQQASTNNNVATYARALKNSKLAQVYMWCVSTVVIASGVFVVSATLLQFSLVSLRVQREHRMASAGNGKTDASAQSLAVTEYSYTKDVVLEALQQFFQIIHQVGALHSMTSSSASFLSVEGLLLRGVRERLLRGVVHAIKYFNSLLEHLLSYCAEGPLSGDSAAAASGEMDDQESTVQAAAAPVPPSLEPVRPLLDLQKQLVQTATLLLTSISSNDATATQDSSTAISIIKEELKLAIETTNEIVVEFGTWLPSEEMLAVNRAALDQIV